MTTESSNVTNPTRAALLKAIDVEVKRIADRGLTQRVIDAINGKQSDGTWGPEPTDARLARFLVDLRQRPTPAWRTAIIPWAILVTLARSMYGALLANAAKDDAAAGDLFAGAEPAPTPEPVTAASVEPEIEPCDDPAFVAESTQEPAPRTVSAVVERWEPYWRLGGSRYGRTRADQPVWARTRTNGSGQFDTYNGQAEVVYVAPSSIASEPTAKVYAVRPQYLRPRQGPAILRYAPQVEIPTQNPATPGPVERAYVSGSSTAGTSQPATTIAPIAQPAPVETQPAPAAPTVNVSEPFDAALAASRARQARIAALTQRAEATGVRPQAQAQPATPPPPPPALTAEMVAQALGAVSAYEVVAGIGDGITVDWMGEDEMDGAGRLDLLARAGLPKEWAHDPKSARAQAAVAAKSVEKSGEVIVVLETKEHRKAAGLPKATKYRARWTVSRPSAQGGAGTSAGDKLAVVTLWEDQGKDKARLVVEGDQTITARILAEYERLRTAEVYDAGRVTTWLQSIIVKRLHGIRFCHAFYVREAHAPQARALVAACRAVGWGRRWSINAATTGEDLFENITSSLFDDVKQIDKDLAKARTEKKDADALATAAGKLLAKLADLVEKAKGFAAVLGREYVERVFAEIERLRLVLTDLVDARGALLELDLDQGEE